MKTKIHPWVRSLLSQSICIVYIKYVPNLTKISLCCTKNINYDYFPYFTATGSPKGANATPSELGERGSYATKPYNPAEFHPGYAGKDGVNNALEKTTEETASQMYNPGEYHPGYAPRSAEDGTYTIPPVYKGKNSKESLAADDGGSSVGHDSDDDRSSSSSSSSSDDGSADEGEGYQVPEAYKGGKGGENAVYPKLN